MNRAILAAVAAAMATSAFAGTVVSNDFDSGPAPWTYTYGAGNLQTSTFAMVPGSGADASQAAKLTMDFSLVSMFGWGTYAGGGIGSYIDVSAQPVSTVLSEYTVTADAKAVGTYAGGGHQRAWLNVEFFAFDDTNPDGTPMATPDADTDSQKIASFLTPRFTLPEGAWTSQSFTFAQLIGGDIDGDGAGTALYTWDNTLLALGASNLHGMNVSLAVEDGANSDGTAPGRFGLDAGNELWADNFQVSVVPEPSSLGAIAAAGLLLARRRK